MVGFWQVSGFDPNIEINMLAAHRCKCISVGLKIASDQRKKIRGLGEWVSPLRPVQAFITITRTGQVTIGEQDWIFGLLRLHPDCVAREYVWPIWEEGDPPKSFSFALRA